MSAFTWAWLVASPAHTQWRRSVPPPESPAWWTLTDEITPEQLRHALTDPELTKQRFLDAVEAGAQQKVPASRLEQLYVCFEGELTPELVPLWYAYAYLAIRRDIRTEVGEPDWLSEQLTGTGISAEGIRAVAGETFAYDARFDGFIESHKRRGNGFLDVLGGARRRASNRELNDLLARRDTVAIANLARRPTAEVQALAEAWELDPILEAALPSITALRKTLTARDWAALRDYLIRVVAPTAGFCDFALAY